MLRDLIEKNRESLRPPLDDQAWYGAHYLAKDSVITLDHDCRVFQNLIGRTVDDFEWQDGKWRNKSTGSTPVVLHGNGPTESRWLLFNVMGAHIISD